ncbi:hypothetical protein BCUN_1843 [Bifidobacterium cuniculi]|uniref:Uncharacterized protein n=1 Tax=Bifidobacterium cuniculi TaxID=1688 RepID=A0A087AT38_9BIFI|nr:hypothetical protein BCUN_1843 [Bifidobacterium cuniculi]
MWCLDRVIREVVSFENLIVIFCQALSVKLEALFIFCFCDGAIDKDAACSV